MSTCAALTSLGNGIQEDGQPPAAQLPADPWQPTYRNWTRTIYDYVSQSYKPRTLYELTVAINQIEADPDAKRRFARAIGATWSFSDITRPGHAAPGIPSYTAPSATDSGYIIDTTLLAGSLQHHLPDLLKPEFQYRADPQVVAKASLDKGASEDVHFLFYVEAGITVTELNQLLDHYYGEGCRLALESTVGGSGQTVAGAFSTGTHGAEPDFGTLADLVQAIYLVGPGGKHYWLEPGALCDPAKLLALYPCLGGGTSGRGPQIGGGIIQNDPDVFNSVLVSFGCMGVIYAVILKATAQFGVVQLRRKTNWEAVIAATPDLSTVLDGSFVKARSVPPDLAVANSPIEFPKTAKPNSFAQLVINPYAKDGDPHTCFVTNRFRTWQREVPYVPVNTTGGGDISHMDISSLKDSLAKLYQMPSFVPFRAPSPDLATAAALNDMSNYVDGLPKSLSTPAEASSIFDWMANYRIPATYLASTTAGLILAVDPAGAIAAAAAAAAILAAGDESYGFNMVMAAIIDWVLDGTLNLEDVWDVGYKVGDVESWGAGISSQSIEVAFGSSAEAIDYVNAILGEVSRRGNVGDPGSLDRAYIAGYISLRICKGSNAHLAVAQFAPHSFVVEYAVLSGKDSQYSDDKHGHPYDERVLDFMKFLQDAAIRRKGVLHWGMSNDRLTHAEIMSMPTLGPNFTQFQNVRNAHFHAKTTFDNDFTGRLQI